jgi:hypothetical protein
METGAVISRDGVYRYKLSRVWIPSKPALTILMLNPSTADEKKDDPTIRKCLWYAGTWHYGGINVVNYCAYRTPMPTSLFTAQKLNKDIIGPENLKWLTTMIQGNDVLIACGNQIELIANRDYVKAVRMVLETAANAVYCIGKTGGGYPKHPLYVGKNTERMVFEWPPTTK